MKNNSLDNEYLDDEIQLRELLGTILNSKKLIVIVTLAFSLIAFGYTSQTEQDYQSNVTLEVGSYHLPNDGKKLIEPVSSLIKKLKISLIYKKRPEFRDFQINGNKLNFNSIEGQLIEINYRSPSPEINEIVINEAIKLTQDSHMEILVNIENSFYDKVKAIDNEIELLKNSLKMNQESQKLTANNSIKIIDNEILALEAKLKFLLKLIPEEENNLLLLQSDNAALWRRASATAHLQQHLYTYTEDLVTLKKQLQNFKQEKNDLEMQVKSITERELTSKELLKLQQEKNNLEFQKNMTQPIRELKTVAIKANTGIIILAGTLFGFIFSIFIVLSKKIFLTKQN
jgi:hypothetical protein